MNEKKSQGQKTVARDGARTRGVSRPLVGASLHQLILLVMDTSGSMQGSKLGEANASMTGLVTELQDEKNRDAFHTAIVVFGTDAKVHMAAKSALQVRPDELILRAGVVGDLTNLTDGLQKALDVIERFRAEGDFARPMVVAMTDGDHNVGDPPDATATALKTKADLLCVAFGADAKLAALQRIATSPQHAFSAATGADLRRFFVTVGRTVSQAARTGANAAALLGQGGVLRG